MSRCLLVEHYVIFSKIYVTIVYSIVNSPLSEDGYKLHINILVLASDFGGHFNYVKRQN